VPPDPLEKRRIADGIAATVAPRRLPQIPRPAGRVVVPPSPGHVARSDGAGRPERRTSGAADRLRLARPVLRCSTVANRRGEPPPRKRSPMLATFRMNGSGPATCLEVRLRSRKSPLTTPGGPCGAGRAGCPANPATW
jgi:hypothetical protein